MSPVLWCVYLEYVLRDLRKSTGLVTSHLAFSTEYADDIDQLSRDQSQLVIMENRIPKIFGKCGLVVNQDKTEKYMLSRSNYKQVKIKKLGSLLVDTDDLKARITRANLVFQQLRLIWFKKSRVPVKSKIRVYNAIVKPIMLYNLHVSGLSGYQLEKIDSAHRRHLRILYMHGIFYPNEISNQNLYEFTGQEPLSIKVRTMRIKLLEHILRLNKLVPAYQTMKHYYQQQQHQNSYGGNYHTLPTQLNHDIKLAKQKYVIHDKHSLAAIRSLTNERPLWNQLDRSVKGRVRRKVMTRIKSKSLKRKIVVAIGEVEDYATRVKKKVKLSYQPLIINLKRKSNDYLPSQSGNVM